MAASLFDGTRTRLADWAGDVATLNARGGTAHPFDLVYIEDGDAALACRDHLLTPLPVSPPAGPDTTVAEDADQDASNPSCTRPAPSLRLVLAWNRAHAGAPAGWSSLWDIAQYPGRRGLHRGPRGTLEIALLADGVAAADVYRVLATPAGVDRAFRRLDQLRPYIAWWDTPAQAVALIRSGAAMMTSAPSGEVIGADAAQPGALGIDWTQTLSVAMDWAIPAGLPPRRLQAALDLLDRLADPGRMDAFVTAYPDGPSAGPAAAAATGPGEATDIASTSGPTAGDRTTGEPGTDDQTADDPTMVVDDDGFWRSHADALHRRFDAWLAAR